MSARTYGQNCGVARALDVLGERWTLLVVRELFLGPRRYRDPTRRARRHRGEPPGRSPQGPGGAGDRLPHDARAAAGVVAYELTAEGEALEPVVSAMALRGYGPIPREDNEDRFRASWVASSMRAAMAAEGGAAPDGRYAFEVEHERF
jgi:DNA-binding HxlR family transcriptional regulator